MNFPMEFLYLEILQCVYGKWILLKLKILILTSATLLKYFWKNKKVKLNKGRKIVPNSKLKANLPLTDQIGRGIVEKYKKIEN